MSKSILPERIKQRAQAIEESKQSRLPPSKGYSTTPASKDLNSYLGIFTSAKTGQMLMKKLLPSAKQTNVQAWATGVQPTEIDKDVFLLCCRIYAEAQTRLGAPVFVKRSDLLKALGWDTNGSKNFKRLHESLEKMSKFMLDIKATKDDYSKEFYGRSLIKYSKLEKRKNGYVTSNIIEHQVSDTVAGGFVSEGQFLQLAGHKDPCLICITMDEELAPFFADGQWYVEDLALRRRLGRSTLARFYYSEFMTHNPDWLAEVAVPLSVYQKRSGSTMSDTARFKRSTKEAMELLVSVGFLSSYEFIKPVLRGQEEKLQVRRAATNRKGPNGQLELFEGPLTDEQRLIQEAYIADVNGIKIAVANIAYTQHETSKIHDELSSYVLGQATKEHQTALEIQKEYTDGSVPGLLD